MKSPVIRRRASRRLGRSTSVAAVAALTLLLGACGGEQPLTTFSDESPIASDLTSILTWLLIVCAVVFVLVQGAVIYMSSRFSVDAPDNEDDIYPDDEFPDQVHGNTRLEIGWTILPTVIMAIVAFFTLALYFQLDDVSAETADGIDRIQRIDVVSQQWWWEFQYHLDSDGIPDIVTAGELPLPVGEEVQLVVTSRDVIHSFWVPALNGKRDTVPGRWNPWTIEAGSVGRFPGECTEFCGLSHAYMEKWAIGLEPADWDTWAANQILNATEPDAGTDAAAGWELFQNNCASCHVVNGLTKLGSGGEGDADTFEIYNSAGGLDLEELDDLPLPVRLIEKPVQVSGAAPNLTHLMSRSTFAGGIFELYENPDGTPYTSLAASGDMNRGVLEAWIRNAPELKANAWDSPGGQRGMTPFTALSAEDIDHLVEFLLTLD